MTVKKIKSPWKNEGKKMNGNHGRKVSNNGRNVIALDGSNTSTKVLVVDDEIGVLNALRRLCRHESFDIVTTTCPREGLAYLANDSFGVVMADQRMPEMDGTRFLEKVRSISPDTIRIIITGYVDIQAAIEAINRGQVQRFVTKPWKDEDLRVVLRESVSRFEVLKENEQLQALTENQNAKLRDINRNLSEARQQEVEVAYKIQQSLLLGASFRDVRGIHVSALTIPAQEIDGDFYDFFKHSDACLDAIIGDVMGKGVPAALLGAGVKSEFLRAMSQLIQSSKENLFDPVQIVQHVHAKLTPRLIDLESFVTLCYVRFDLEKRLYHLVDCGHTRTIHIQPHLGTFQLLRCDNMPLGCFEKQTFDQVSGSIEPEDLFFFYSDGLTEAKNKAKESFGEKRLFEVVKQNSHCDPEALIHKTYETIIAFKESEKFTDDLTCVAVQVQNI